jgi:hypothetical protein
MIIMNGGLRIVKEAVCDFFEVLSLTWLKRLKKRFFFATISGCPTNSNH